MAEENLSTVVATALSESADVPPSSSSAAPRPLSAPVPLGGDAGTTTRRRRGYTERAGQPPDTAPVEVTPVPMNEASSALSPLRTSI